MEQKNLSPNCIGIVGLGLIGGSLGLELQAQGFQVHGLVHRPTTAKKAKERDLAQVISTDTQILADCDLIILALPIDKLLKPSSSLLNALPTSAVITDVASVKAPVLKVWEKIHHNFVASHPMAGANEAGVEAGRLGLFQQRPWISTPEQNTNPIALEKVHQLAISLGAQWITSDPNMHDEAVALISHLPVLISAALLRTTDNKNNEDVLSLARNLASSGFADTTRVGGGNPILGTSMITNNTDQVLQALKAYRLSLDQLEQTIKERNWKSLLSELEKAKKIRPRFLKSDS